LAKATTQVKILVPGEQSMVALLGQRDELLKLVEAAFDSEIVVRGNEITIAGPEGEVERIALLFEELVALLERGHELNASSVGRSIELIKGDEATPTQVLGDVFLTGRGRGIAPKTLGQKRYVDAMRDATVTFAIGPAGTGKTYLAVATAVRALQDKQVSRLILTRPAVEAGERLGFLPGDLMAKIDPYLRPLFDALHDMIDPEKVATHLERNVIEVAPLAFMRGRTLNDSFVILDEAQNTSPEQMKMFLTRLGFNSKMVITGDITQIDLPRDQRSGLVVVSEILAAVEGVQFVRFGGADVVRHRLVQRIVEAYDEHSERAAPELRPAEQPDRRRA
jgi:phosphate starvation-inducible PhoH-like protein